MPMHILHASVWGLGGSGILIPMVCREFLGVFFKSSIYRQRTYGERPQLFSLISRVSCVQLHCASSLFFLPILFAFSAAAPFGGVESAHLHIFAYGARVHSHVTRAHTFLAGGEKKCRRRRRAHTSYSAKKGWKKRKKCPFLRFEGNYREQDLETA